MIQHFFPQSLSVGSGQQLVFRTQYGPMYQPNTNCTVNIKVSKLKNITHTQRKHTFLLFTERQLMPVSFGVLPKIWHSTHGRHLSLATGWESGLPLTWRAKVCKSFGFIFFGIPGFARTLAQATSQRQQPNWWSDSPQTRQRKVEGQSVPSPAPILLQQQQNQILALPATALPSFWRRQNQAVGHLMLTVRYFRTPTIKVNPHYAHKGETTLWCKIFGRRISLNIFFELAVCDRFIDWLLPQQYLHIDWRIS